MCLGFLTGKMGSNNSTSYCLESVVAPVFIIFIASISGRGSGINKDKELGSGGVWEMVRY